MFEPYIAPMGFRDLDFFFATELAEEWYDPPKEYVKLEYEWVLENVKLKDQNVIDGGAHHGHYSLILAQGFPAKLTAVEPQLSNCCIWRANMSMFANVPVTMIQAPIWNKNERVWFSGESNGHVNKTGAAGVGEWVQAFPLEEIDEFAQVVKLDIEGIEYLVVPENKMRKVHTWIVETHLPGPAEELAQYFISEGYEVHWVNRETMRVEKYEGAEWTDHSTIFARR